MVGIHFTNHFRFHTNLAQTVSSFKYYSPEVQVLFLEVGALIRLLLIMAASLREAERTSMSEKVYYFILSEEFSIKFAFVRLFKAILYSLSYYD